ncbi:MAG: BrnT family toxin [Chloroflexi bacterium]|nr:MAG: BrnT family toxin [Chloroflexota bacterium]
MKTTYKLEDIDFEWDSEKAETNVQKHGVSFMEACEIFFDPFIRSVEPQEEKGETRDAAIGLTRKWRLLYVAYVWRRLAIRIISARKATKAERKKYENQ